jgi:hypothetical protein
LIPSLLRQAGVTAEKADEQERRLITLYRQRSLPFWPEGYPQTDWEHLFSMQHHGVMTRLLDWTENVFVALWFALEADCATHEDGACSPTLWLLDPQELNRAALAHMYEDDSPVPVLTTADDDLQPYAPFIQLGRRPKPPVALFGTHNSVRIASQRGTFTIAGREVIAIEGFVERGEQQGPVLQSLGLTGGVADMRADLRAFGFTTSMIYPDLPGLARDLVADVGL